MSEINMPSDVYAVCYRCDCGYARCQYVSGFPDWDKRCPKCGARLDYEVL
jgi:hypothetical protein